MFSTSHAGRIRESLVWQGRLGEASLPTASECAQSRSGLIAVVNFHVNIVVASMAPMALIFFK